MNRVFLVFVIALGFLFPVKAEETPSAKAILARALSTAREIDDVHDRAWALADVFYAQSRLGDEQAARQLKTELIEIAKAILDAELRDQLLRRVIAVQAGSWVEVYESETFEGAIAYLETVGVDAATTENAQAELTRIRDALVVSRLIEDPEERFWALWSIVRPAIENRRFNLLREPVDEALGTAQLISDDSMRLEVVAIIARLQTLSGDRSGARSTIIEAISTTHLLTSEAHRAETLCNMAAAQYAAGDETGANATAKEALSLAKLTDSVAAFGKIAAWEAKMGNAPFALVAARAIEDSRARALALVEVAATLGTVRDGGTVEILREAIELLQQIEDRGHYDDWLIRMLQSALTSPVDMLDLLSVVVAVRNHYFLYFWDSARMAVATAAPIARSFDTLMATVGKVEDPASRLSELWLLGEALLLADDRLDLQRITREALGIIHPAIATGQSYIGVFEFSEALPIIALGQAEGGDSDGALRTVDEMLALYQGSEYDWVRDALLRQAATVRARAGAIALAIATTEGIVDPEVQVRALTAVALGGRSGRAFYLGL